MAGPQYLGPAIEEGRLEVELASELQLARIASTGDLARTTGIAAGEWSPGGWRRQGVVHVCPLGVVEDVEALKPQLDARVFCEVEVLVKRHVEIQNARTVNCIAMEIAEAAWSGYGECCRVEPHWILTCGLAVAVRSLDGAAQVVRPDMTETTV